MDPQEVLILIKDEIKTEDVVSLTFDNARFTCVVVFNNKKSYRYNAGNVECLKNPRQYDFKDQRISANGIELCNIKSILEFRNPKNDRRYWHIVFKDTAEGKTYKYEDLKILNRSENDYSNSILNYLKDVAANNPLLVQENLDNNDKITEVSLLKKQYEKIKGINGNTALSLYLNPDFQGNQTPIARQDLIFPFGCNLSQINAVQNAFKYPISLIQGPPGTGKTQTILNILANLLIQGKTALVVSNNNSAIKNVQEKLTQYKLDFLTAMLGSVENKDIFIQTQGNRKIDLPNGEYSQPLFLWKKDISEKVAAAKNLFSSQNELAQLKNDYDNAKKNYEHFRVYLEELGILKYIPENRKWLAHYELKDILDQLNVQINCSPKAKRLPLTTRFSLRFIKGLFNWKFLRGDISAVIVCLENLCFIHRLSEYEKRIRNLTSTVKNHENASDDLLQFSKAILLENISKKVTQQKQPLIYTKEDLYYKWERFLMDYPIVFSTTFASKSALNSKAVFDYVIMDESSQVDIATGALALSCARNAVIVGDSKQLEKVTTREEKEKYDEIFAKHNVPQIYNCADMSFLDSIAGLVPTGAQTLLKEHYRCHPKIIEFCNQKFYDNQLIIHSNRAEGNPLVIHWTAPTSQENNVNQKQIEAISQEILPNLKSNDIGIIAPYRRQCYALRKVVSGLDISTIHKFQGREKNTIIFSTVDNVLTEFSGDPQIINVAISRAKNQFILVTSKQEQPKGSLLDDLIGYIQYNSGVSTESAIYSIFDFLFDQKSCKSFEKGRKISKYPSENAAYEMICKVLENCPSLEVYFEYPMNHLIRDFSRLSGEPALLNYARHPSTHIDFFITNRITKQPVLAVEIDGANFHKADSVQGIRDRMKNRIFECYGIDYVRFTTKGSGEEGILKSKLKGYMNTSLYH